MYKNDLHLIDVDVPIYLIKIDFLIFSSDCFSIFSSKKQTHEKYIHDT